DVARDGLQSALDGSELGLGQQTDPSQHGAVRQGTLDILLPQAPIERDGFGEVGDFRGRAVSKPSAARDRRIFLCALQSVATLVGGPGKVTREGTGIGTEDGGSVPVGTNFFGKSY